MKPASPRASREKAALEVFRAIPRVEERNIARRNAGELEFEDVGASWGLDEASVAHGAVFSDLDRDGRLDLFVGRYVDWSPATELACRPDGERRAYCTPERYPGQSSRLYRNLGQWRFQEITPGDAACAAFFLIDWEV